MPLRSRRFCIISVIAVALAAFAIAARAQFNQPLLTSGGVPAHIVSATITAVSFCSNNSCTFNPGTTNAVGQATVTLSSGMMFAGTFSMPNSGTATNPPGASCPNNSANFTISSSGLLSSTTSSANQNYTVCIAASEAGLGAPNPYIQVVSLTPTTSIACDIGPRYNGSIPAGAVRAGYTRCAVNMDFTQFTNANQVIDCLGASSPLLYQDPFEPLYSQCSTAVYKIVPDQGSNSLELTLQAANYPTRAYTGLLSWQRPTTAYSPYTGWTLPEGYYIEQTWRVVNRPTFNVNNGTGGGYLEAGFLYTAQNPGCSGNGTAWFEVDPGEMGTDLHNSQNGPYGTSSCVAQVAPPRITTIFSDVSQYTTFGVRLAGDGSNNAAACFYQDAGIVNGSQNAASQLGCNLLPNITTSGADLNGLWTSRVGLQFGQVGIYSAVGNQGPNTAISGDLVVAYKRYTIWSCANWRDNNSNINQSSNQCYPGFLTGTP